MKTIIWDIDDVLNDLMLEWFVFYIKSHPIKIDYSHLSKNPPNELLGITLDYYHKSLDEFRQQYFIDLKPVEQIYQWFEKYGSKFKHVAVSSVPFTCSHLSAQWLINNFGRWVRTFHFIPSYRKNIIIPKYDNTKGDFIKSLNKVDLFIDDNEKNIEEVKNLGIKTITFPRPWNSKSRKGIQRFLIELNGILM